MQRPLTVAGLIAKRDELTRHQKAVEAELKRVTVDLIHLEGAIRLFEVEDRPFQSFTMKNRAKMGHMTRFVLATLRDATAPMTPRQIGDAWSAEQGFVDDARVSALMRTRAAATLNTLRKRGLVEHAEKIGDAQGWRLA